MIPQNDMCPVCDYGSAAIYRDLPSPEQIASGVVPLDSLPAAWWNCMWFDTNRAVNQARCELGILIEEINTVLNQAGVCACDTCVNQLYQSIDKIRQTLGTSSVAGAVKSSSDPSAVAIDNQGFMSVNCLGNASSLTTAATTVVGAINELKSTYDCCWTDNATALSGKAPTSHADSATTYGVGNATCYGHLKISDTYTSDLGDAGTAASQTALYCVYCFASDIAAGVASLGNTAGCANAEVASAGTCSTAARSDHVHPIGNAHMLYCCTGTETSICECRVRIKSANVSTVCLVGDYITCTYSGGAWNATCCLGKAIHVAWSANSGCADTSCKSTCSERIRIYSQAVRITRCCCSCPSCFTPVRFINCCSFGVIAVFQTASTTCPWFQNLCGVPHSLYIPANGTIVTCCNGTSAGSPWYICGLRVY